MNITETSLVDPFNSCSQYISLNDFDVGHCDGINDDYRLITKEDAMEWKSSPWNCEWTNGRRSYISLRSPHSCIWWDVTFRHWWIGDCEKRGNNFGSAFLEPNEECPHHNAEGNWKRSGTNENLWNGKIVELMSGDETLQTNLPLGIKLFSIDLLSYQFNVCYLY